MSNAIRRGRTLDPNAVRLAWRWRQDRIKHLESIREQGTALPLTKKERHELSRIGGTRHPAKIGE